LAATIACACPGCATLRDKTDPGSPAIEEDSVTIHMVSRLHASREEVWRWISSVEGISTEMRPYFRMTAPDGVRALTDVKVELGKPIFRSRVYLFGLVPAGYWDMTLIELDPGRGFVEHSPSDTMKDWRHERRLYDCPDEPTCVVLVDDVTFVPRWSPGVVGRFIRRVFEHRHRVLRSRFSWTVRDAGPSGVPETPGRRRTGREARREDASWPLTDERQSHP
jgi:ligand-binding SRPBCC domain-containing protein